MLKKHGLVDDRGKPGGPSKRRVGGGRAGFRERGGLSDEDEDMAGPGNGRVPEPEPESIERLLTEIDKAHGEIYLDPISISSTRPCHVACI